ncbi:ATP-grasp domain-containing protein [Candidatus Saccharibacteria bacterium]|nr:ATP-grasp domain-containing protein [Candidatus Saccharibacteria bacterium]
MIDLKTIPDEQLSQTIRIMKAHFIDRGWEVEIPYIGSSHCFITRHDGKKFHIFSATPPTTSFAAAHLANDKYGTYQALLGSGLPQPETHLLYNSDNTDEIELFMDRVKKVVIKPVDGGHGKGITVNVATAEQLQRAIAIAQAEEKSIAAVLVQAQYQHDAILDIRILCIDNTFTAATWRVPARVYGDGKSTVSELIEAENNKENRGRPYYAPLSIINIEQAKEFLGERINDVPKLNAEVPVLGIANYGAGGETIDITDELPGWLKEMAEEAARACEMPVIGVDFMLAHMPTPTSTIESLDPVIIEVNKCPSFVIHDKPTSGTPRDVVGTYVEYLSTI